MVCSWNKMNSKYMIFITLGIFIVYIPLNILYVITIGLTDIKIPVKQKRADHDSESIFPIRVKEFIPGADGKVDMVLTMDMNELIKVMGATAVGSFRGEFTNNPLPVNTTFVVNNPDACKNIPDLQYIIYVHSAPKNVERRRIMRSTWSSKSLFKKQISKLVFMMGSSTDEKDQKIVDEEHKLYGDIVQGSFIENYKNLTLKGIMGLKWVSQYCQEAPFAIKADDDAFVNIFRVMEIIEQHKHKKRMIVCPLWKDNTMPILRDPTKCMKWCVKYNEFPGRSHFPQYCAGLTFIMSRDIIPEMYRASFSTPFFWIDDVYVTGALTPKVKNIEYIDLVKNFTLKEAIAHDEYMKNGAVTHLFAHVKKPPNFHDMWNATLNRLTLKELETLGDTVFKDYPYLKKKLELKER